MIFEFDSHKDRRHRSSAHYAYDAFFPFMYLNYVLIAMGHWNDDHDGPELRERFRIGFEDLDYKIDPARGGGYYSIANGKGYALPYVYQTEKHGHPINLSLAEDVIAVPEPSASLLGSFGLAAMALRSGLRRRPSRGTMP